jgi:hypothetical protein
MLFEKSIELKFTHGPTNSTRADKSRAGIRIGNGETYPDLISKVPWQRVRGDLRVAVRGHPDPADPCYRQGVPAAARCP